jgi:phage terminase small subunit
MPTPYKTTDNMNKHLTKAEREARQAAEGGLRGERTQLRAPKWLSEDARKVFDATKRRARNYGVLESVDADLLALYANAVVEARDTEDPKDAQAWSRVVLSYAEKLGLSATGRARLAKKKAEQAPMDDLEALLGDVTDYVNGDVR